MAHMTTRTRTLSTAHEEREAFALLDDAIDALSAIARHSDTDQNTVPVDAVLIVRVQHDDGDGHRIGHVAIYPRAGAQPASTRTLIRDAGKLLDQATADGAAGDEQPATPPLGTRPLPPTPRRLSWPYATLPLVSPKQKTAG